MFKISKKGDYGLVFLSYLTKKNDTAHISLRTVSDDTNIPYKFLSQIALELKNAGLIDSKEGSTGGYKLNKLPEDISVKDVIEALEGPISPVGCLKGKTCRCRDACLHRPTMNIIASSLIDTLSKQKLSDIVKN